MPRRGIAACDTIVRCERFHQPLCNNILGICVDRCDERLSLRQEVLLEMISRWTPLHLRRLRAVSAPRAPSHSVL
jgi:hypothetical protein